MAINDISPLMTPDPEEQKAVVVLSCPTCKRHTAHKTKGVKANAALGGQSTQAMECTACKTVSVVATSKDGRDFQANVDAPDGM